VWVGPKEYKIVGAALAAARGRAGLTNKSSWQGCSASRNL